MNNLDTEAEQAGEKQRGKKMKSNSKRKCLRGEEEEEEEDEVAERGIGNREKKGGRWR